MITPITVVISGGVKSELRDYANYGGIFFPEEFFLLNYANYSDYANYGGYF